MSHRRYRRSCGPFFLFIWFFFTCFCVSGTNTLNYAAAVSAVCFGRDGASCSRRNMAARSSRACLLSGYLGDQAPPPRPCPAHRQLAALLGLPDDSPDEV